MPLVVHVQMQLRLSLQGSGEGQTDGNDERIVVIADRRVGFRELSRHLRPILIGPGHQEGRLRTVLAHRLAVPFGGSAKRRLELRMDRTLAAIHHQHDVEQLLKVVEHDVVCFVEGIGTERLGPEVGFDIVPIQPATRDGNRRRSQARRGIGRGVKARHVPADAVVEGQEAVADIEDRTNLLTNLGLLRPPHHCLPVWSRRRTACRSSTTSVHNP